MNNLVFHNNYHRNNHHTVSILNYPDSSKDPIASLEYPFLGTFYNNYYNVNGNYIGKSNSYDWWRAYTLTNTNSAIWDRSKTIYTTVNSKSANWDQSFKAYTTLKTNSANWESTYLTFTSNINDWDNALDPQVEYTNKAQEDTRQKTFRNLTIHPSDSMNIVLDLNVGQVTTYDASGKNSKFTGFTGQKKGGIYHLILIYNNDNNSSFQVEFDSDFFTFPDNENTYVLNGKYLIKIKFLCDGQLLHGKLDIYDKSNPLVTLVDKIPIKRINGETIYPLTNKGMVDFDDRMIDSFDDQEIFPF